ncbi:MAG: GWxTD domain-containing protein [Bacteroidales bacterium]|nr:GWxTD domain-containing protein [Candidatus Latescibacterota bacterium]
MRIQSLLAISRLACLILACAFLILPGELRPAGFYGEQRLYDNLTKQEKEEYNSLQYMMNEYQRKQYLSLPDSNERERWAQRFWLELDPTPMTRRNERRVEYRKRVRQAKKMYPMNKPPGWDRRGEALIRFGEPDSKVHVPANLDYWNERMPGEVWSYFKYDMIVAFEDPFLQNEYTWFMESGGISSRQMEEIRRASSAAAASSGAVQTGIASMALDPHDNLSAASANPYSTDYIASMDAGGHFGPSIYTDVGLDAKIDRVEEQLNNFFVNVDKKKFFHSTDLEENLTLYFDFTSFSAGNGKLRTEVNLEIPADELKFRKKSQEYESKFSLAVSVRDMEMKEVLTVSNDVVLSVDKETRNKPGQLFPAQFILTLDPGYYRFAIEIFDKRTGKRGTYRTSSSLENIGGELSLSDIQFASFIGPADGNQSFVKGNLRVVPHPLHVYRKSSPLKFYFEIYGLETDEKDIAFYSIQYSIHPKEKRRKGPVFVEIESVISSEFNTSGYGIDQPQRLEIATDELWEGAFILKVKVMDRITRTFTERSASFSILD